LTVTPGVTKRSLGGSGALGSSYPSDISNRVSRTTHAQGSKRLTEPLPARDHRNIVKPAVLYIVRGRGHEPATVEKNANSGADIQAAWLRSQIERDRPIRNIFVKGDYGRLSRVPHSQLLQQPPECILFYANALLSARTRHASGRSDAWFRARRCKNESVRRSHSPCRGQPGLGLSRRALPQQYVNPCSANWPQFSSHREIRQR
jgi:hypothetical protein